MTYEEYFEGLGCSPDEVQTCVAGAKAHYRGQLHSAAEAIGRGDILSGDPVERELDHFRDEMAEAASQ